MIADKFMVAKLDGAQEVLQRLPFPTTAQKLPQRREVRLGQFFGKPQIQVQAAAAEDVGQQVLHVQPGLLDALFFEVGGAGGEDFEERFGGGIQDEVFCRLPRPESRQKLRVVKASVLV